MKGVISWKAPLVWTALGALLVGAVGWLVTNAHAKLSAKDAITAEFAAARQVALAVRLYAADEGGLTVEQLDDLVRMGVLKDDSLIYKTLPNGTKRARWHYFPFTDSQQGGKPVLVSTESLNGGKRIVVTADTSVELMKWDDRSEEWLRKQKEK
jgi:hypothetical protein